MMISLLANIQVNNEPFFFADRHIQTHTKYEQIIEIMSHIYANKEADGK